MKEIAIESMKFNPVLDFGKNWMALTAGTAETGYNSMTVAWGHVGSIWGKEGRPDCMPTVVCYVRPGRYTKGFMDREPFFTLSAFDEKYKKALAYIGSHSGRDGDKIKAAGLTPVHAEGTTYFAEADMVYICRTLYQAPLLEEGFRDKTLIDLNYPIRDYHEMYIGEILKVLVKE